MIEPLNFDSNLVESYIKSLNSDLAQRNLIDEMDYLYEEMTEKERKERLENLDIIERMVCCSEEDLEEED